MNVPRQGLESGYFIDEAVVSDNECQELLDTLSSSSLIRRGRAGSRHLMSEPAVKRIASDARMIRIARRVLGPHAVPYRATLFEKSINANWLVVWHQDTALPLQLQFDLDGWGPWSRKQGLLYSHAPAWALSRIVALRLHLDAATVENGPLRILPGTHAYGVLADADVFALAHSQPHVDCIVPRGGVMSMYPLLVHSSGKVQSAEPRRVLHIEYADSLELAQGIRLDVA
jgi:hypothetical protein